MGLGQHQAWSFCLKATVERLMYRGSKNEDAKFSVLLIAPAVLRHAQTACQATVSFRSISQKAELMRLLRFGRKHLGVKVQG